MGDLAGSAEGEERGRVRDGRAGSNGVGAARLVRRFESSLGRVEIFPHGPKTVNVSMVEHAGVFERGMLVTILIFSSFFSAGWGWTYKRGSNAAS